MNLMELLELCHSKGISMRLVDGNLKIGGQAERLDEATLSLLREHKPALIDYLAQEHSVVHETYSVSSSPCEGMYIQSLNQRSMYFLHQINKKQAACNLPSIYVIQGEIDQPALASAFQQLIERHEVLRTCYGEKADNAKVLDQSLFELRCDDLSRNDLAEDQLNAKVEEMINTEACAHFDLARGEVIRARLLQVKSQEYVLLLTLHHIAADGWSWQVITDELSELYRNAKDNRPSVLQPLPLQYSDYAISQRQWLNDDGAELSLAYWRKKMSGAPALHGLPTDFPRPAQLQFSGRSFIAMIEPPQRQQLIAMQRETDATLFVLLQSLLSVLVARYSGEHEHVIGTPVHGRHDADLESLCGYFVNMLPLRVDTSGDVSFLELVKRNSNCVKEMLEHQWVPFELIVNAVAPERSNSQSPLFQIVFSLHNKIDDLQLAGANVERQLPSVLPSRFDLNLHAVDDGQQIQLLWEYNTALFSEASIRQLSGHYLQLLRAVLASPEAAIEELPMSPSTELDVVQDTHYTVFPASQCLHQSIQHFAGVEPDSTAVSFEGKHFSYGYLNRKADVLAVMLLEAGVTRNSIVGLCSERSIEMLIGMVAILKAGGAYLPLDPAYPKERLDYVLADAQPVAVIKQAGTKVDLDAYIGQVIVLDSGQLPDRAAPVAAPQSQPDDLAYVIYTSGSTGQPKGVMVSHANVLRLFSSAEQHFSFGTEDVWTLFHSFAFDFSVWEIWGAFLYGGRLAIVSQETSRSPELFARLLAEEGVTVLNQTPSAFYPLSKQLIADESLLALRYVVFGGEALELPKLQSWFRHFGDTRPTLVNMYGITETTVHVTHCKLDAEMVVSSASVIGVPLSDLQVYVCNPKMQRQPCRVAGEMYVGGAGVTLGYLNRPELSAERFIDNPFGPGKLYRTGDLARWLPGGQLEYLGRIDHQVKVRGFRIELGEIESRLSQHPEVVHSTVLVSEEEEHKRLLAWVQVASRSVSVDELRTYLTAFLPTHMVPHHIFTVDEMPLTVNGKVDRNRLLAMERVAVSVEFIAPATEQECKLAVIWQQVLGVAQVGITDNFFAIGGDSMLALQVVAEANAQGLACDVSTLFRSQTIQSMLTQPLDMDETLQPVDEAISPFALLPDPHVERIKQQWGDTVIDAYPASSLQEGMLFHSLSGEHSESYHDLLAYEAEVLWDPIQFESALRSVVERHEILRTRFDISAGTVCQLVCAESAIEWRCEDWRTLTGQEQHEAFHHWLQQERQRPFNIEALPLFRVFIHRLEDQRFIYTLSVLHAVLDGWSVSQLNTELFSRYHAGMNRYAFVGAESPLPYSAFIQQELSARQSQAIAARWRQRLHSASVTALDFPLSASTTQIRVKRQYPEFAALSDKLMVLASRLGVPMQHLLLAGHLKVLSLLTGSSDVLSCLVTNGRPAQRGSEFSLGLFLNAMPVRHKLERGSWVALIRSLSHTLNDSMADRHYPLQDIQHETGLTLDKILFNYIHFHSYEQLDGLSKFNLKPLEMVDQSNFELSVQFVHLPGDRIVLELQVPGEDENLPYVASMAGYYQRVFEQMLEDPDAFHSDSKLLPAKERAYLLEKARTPVPPPAGKLTLTDYFDAQCQHRPQATALRYLDTNLTYHQLDQASNRIAHWLVTRGQGEGSRIGINLSRTPEMVMAILAILKLGATYVPLDPAYPAERLSMIADDAALSLILAQHKEPWHADAADTVVPFGADSEVALSAYSTRPLPLSAKTNDNRYLIYTSGSTGKPKGVRGTEHGIINRLNWMWDCYPFAEGEVGCLKTSINFVDHIWELFGCLLKGVPLVMLEQEDVVDTRRLVENLSQYEVSRIVLVPTLIQAILSLPAEHLMSLKALKWWTSSGERLPDSLVQAFYRQFPEAVLLNLYGSSEVSADVTCFDTRETVDADGISCIGSPIANTQLFVLNDDLQLLPAGVQGELYVGGAGVAEGYTNPAQTRARFVDSPFGEGRLFKTGDIVRWHQDGKLLYIGRNDDQVKIRGHRVELGDIENALVMEEGIAQATVAIVDRNSEDVIAAYLVTDQDNQLDLEMVRQQLALRLPSAMIPAAFMVLDSLPLNPNGKIDKQRLPEPSFASTHSYQPPRNKLEHDLCAIWQRQLQVEKVGISDSFFMLGGNSITALKLAAQMEPIAGQSVPLSVVFEYKTIARLSDYFAKEARRQEPAIQTANNEAKMQNNRMKL